MNLLLKTSLLSMCLSLVYAGPCVIAASAEGTKTNTKTEEKKEEPKDTTSVTQHSVTVNGKELKYTATAGKLVMRDDEGKAKGAHLLHCVYEKRRGGFEHAAGYVCI